MLSSYHLSHRNAEIALTDDQRNLRMSIPFPFLLDGTYYEVTAHCSVEVLQGFLLLIQALSSVMNPGKINKLKAVKQ